MNAPLHRPFGLALPVVVGHRGAPRVAPENTPAAFRAAARAGARWVELDVRRSADGLAVAHDACLPDGRALLGLTMGELRGHGIHSLGDVLDGLPPGLGVDVELKNLPGDPDYDDQDRMALAVAPLVGRAAEQRPLFVSSFNPSTLMAVSIRAPEIQLGLLHGQSLRAPAGLSFAEELGAAVLCSHLDAPGLDAALVDAAHAAGLALMVWTVDDPERARSLAAIGVDAICTNEVAAIVAALRPRP
jgi:glycerophosphoryl diester phosphodiesterase